MSNSTSRLSRLVSKLFSLEILTSYCAWKPQKSLCWWRWGMMVVVVLIALGFNLGHTKHKFTFAVLSHAHVAYEGRNLLRINKIKTWKKSFFFDKCWTFSHVLQNCFRFKLLKSYKPFPPLVHANFYLLVLLIIWKCSLIPIILWIILRVIFWGGWVKIGRIRNKFNM